MDDVFAARIRLEIARGPDAGRLFSVIEHARGRSLLELLVNTPIADVERPTALRAGEKRIAALQVELLQTTDRDRRKHLEAEHVLDWFHVTMRLTVLGQMAKSLRLDESDRVEQDAATSLESLKWYLWHGTTPSLARRCWPTGSSS